MNGHIQCVQPLACTHAHTLKTKYGWSKKMVTCGDVDVPAGVDAGEGEGFEPGLGGSAALGKNQDPVPVQDSIVGCVSGSGSGSGFKVHFKGTDILGMSTVWAVGQEQGLGRYARAGIGQWGMSRVWAVGHEQGLAGHHEHALRLSRGVPHPDI